MKVRVGLEFHQRLDTHKLFCSCSSEQGGEKIAEIVRRLRPVVGELGERDPAALLEALKSKEYEYLVYDDTSCLVECDEEPPHELNNEALDIALEIALLLNCEIVDESHVMRKIVIDGSNTTGFQRTMMIGRNGFIETKHGRIKVEGVFLEEEAAGIVGEKKRRKVYRLDRLGIPLVEISTGIMELSPVQVKEVALELGKLLRMTGKVKRGIGSIRQDVNISIPEGARVEIKGLQDVKLLDKLIELEVMRQENLLKLKQELRKNKAVKSDGKFFEVTKYFKNSKSRLFSGKEVYCLVLKSWAGLLGFELTPGRRFGTELAGIAKAFGLKGIVHTDEDLEKYKITEEVKRICNDKKLSSKDALIFLVADKGTASKVFQKLAERINLAFEKVPEETRRALPDGNSEFMRYLAGKHRMYPETDLPPVFISKARLDALRKNLPKKPEEVLKELRAFGLSEELAEKLVTSPRRALFEELVKQGVNPKVVAVTLEETIKSLRREGVDVSRITDDKIRELFAEFTKGLFSKEAIPSILKSIAEAPEKKVKELIKAGKVNVKQLEEEALKILEQNKHLKEDKRKAFKAIMGELMKKYRGKIDGKIIAEAVKKAVGL